LSFVGCKEVPDKNCEKEMRTTYLLLLLLVN
jgi:hypothetical protein